MSSQETGVIRMADLSPEYAEIMVLGKVLQMSGYFTDVSDQAQAVTKILYGRELGFSPIIAMSGIHIIEGKPALSANLLAATIKRSGKYNYRVKEWDDQHCVITFKEKVEGKWEDVGDSAFSIKDAQTAKVKFKSANGHDTSWTKYPKAMLFARALSQGERAYCPDVSACALYVPEELGAVVNENGDVAELPKGRSTAVTTEDIPLSMPAKIAAPPKLTATVKEVEAPAKEIIGDDVARELFRASELADQGAGRNGFVDDPPEIFYEAVKKETEAKSAKPKVDPNFVEFPNCITVAQKKHLAREWEKACDEAMAPKERERLRGEWLVTNGFVHDGKPTSALIPAAIFTDMVRVACNVARKYKPNVHGMVIDDTAVQF